MTDTDSSACSTLPPALAVAASRATPREERNLFVRKPRLVLLLLAAAVAVALATVAAAPPRLSQALSAQRDLIDAEPGNAEALNDYGNLLVMAGDNLGAEDAYRQALTRDPSMVSARYNLALLHQQRGELDAAARELQKIVDDVPDHAWAWYQIGAVRELEGRRRPAVAAYARAFELDPLLSFHDVNPQVIDSKLTGRALLRASARRSSAAEAPRSYAQPARVAGLLLPPPPDLEEDLGEDSRRAAARASGAAVTPEPGETAGRRAEVKVLTLDDLESGSRVGEATPPAGAGPVRGAPGWRQLQVGGSYRPGTGASDDAPPPDALGEGPGFGTPTTGRVRLRRDDG